MLISVHELIIIMFYLGLIPAIGLFLWMRKHIEQNSFISLPLIMLFIFLLALWGGSPYALIQRGVLVSTAAYIIAILYFIVFIFGISLVFSKADESQKYGNWWRRFLQKNHPDSK